MDNLEDVIMVKDLNVSEEVEILRDPEEIIISISAPENVEEELSKPVEEETVAPEEEKEEEKEEEEGKEEKEGAKEEEKKEEEK
jgi:large subunit ribosomal protein L25